MIVGLDKRCSNMFDKEQSEDKNQKTFDEVNIQRTNKTPKKMSEEL